MECVDSQLLEVQSEHSCCLPVNLAETVGTRATQRFRNPRKDEGLCLDVVQEPGVEEPLSHGCKCCIGRHLTVDSWCFLMQLAESFQTFASAK